MHTCISCLSSVYPEIKSDHKLRYESRDVDGPSNWFHHLAILSKTLQFEHPILFPNREETKQNVTLKELQWMSLLSSSAFSQQGLNSTCCILWPHLPILQGFFPIFTFNLTILPFNCYLFWAFMFQKAAIWDTKSSRPTWSVGFLFFPIEVWALPSSLLLAGFPPHPISGAEQDIVRQSHNGIPKKSCNGLEEKATQR